MNLFQWGEFTSHAGKKLDWKIECEALTDLDYECLSKIIASKYKFSKVYGIPRGGVKLAHFLSDYVSDSGPVLIVDDVFTTGKSMKEAREKFPDQTVIGVVIFARTPTFGWITPVFNFEMCDYWEI